MGKILRRISIKLNLTPNTLGSSRQVYFFPCTILAHSKQPEPDLNPLGRPQKDILQGILGTCFLLFQRIYI